MAEGSATGCAEKLFKVLVIGDLGVGKSSIILQYCKKRFDEKYKATIGVDFMLKTIELDGRTVVRLQLWDIGGGVRTKYMPRVYYRGAMGVVVVFDITNSSTLERASEWKRHLDNSLCLDTGRPIPAVLLANKCDMTGTDGDLVSSLDRFCRDNSFTGWFETSAKENINIDEAGAFLVKQMMLCNTGSSNQEDHSNGINVSHPPGENQSRTWCC